MYYDINDFNLIKDFDNVANSINTLGDFADFLNAAEAKYPEYAGYDNPYYTEIIQRNNWVEIDALANRDCGIDETYWATDGKDVLIVDNDGEFDTIPVDWLDEDKQAILNKIINK